MLDAFRIEVLAMNDTIARQEVATKEQIQTDLRAERKERERAKATKPMNRSVAQRFESMEAQYQETVTAQEQITEELSVFQESFEHLVQKLEQLEIQQKESKTQEKLQQVTSRVELEQQERNSM